MIAGCLMLAGLPVQAIAARVPFSIDATFTAAFERAYTTQFPSRWTNQVRGTAWRTAHDAAANYIRDSWEKLLAPLASEGAFAELRPFNFSDPTGTQPDNVDPIGISGPENNVLAFVPGSDPALRNQIIIVGGHYDCVDITVDGGLDCGMQVPATTAVLEGLVRYWTANNIRPRRSFAAFAIDGEEQCLCGSVHYTTVGSPNALFHHLELPPQVSVAAYHDTDMIGANYPNRYFGLSSNDFMPMNVFSAPSVDDPTRALAPFAAYQSAVANPAFLTKFKLYRRAIEYQRDRYFTDYHAKYPTWTYRDGLTEPLFTDAQKKYVNIVDDPLDRSDHTVFIDQGVPADINIGLNDPTAAPPGWIPYHHVGETQEEVAFERSGTMSLNADTLLGYEATSGWIAYLSGAGEDSSPTLGPFFLGETMPAELQEIPGVRLASDTAILPEMPSTQISTRWKSIGPAGTIVRALAVDPFDPHTLYLASQDRGFVVSRDGGDTFVESNTGLGPYTSLWSITPDPKIRGRLWASSHRGGVFRSDNGGRTWATTHGARAAVRADLTFAKPSDPVNSTDLLKDNVAADQKRATRGGMWIYGIDQCLAQYAAAGHACATRADWPADGYDAHPMQLDYYRYASEVAVAGTGAVLGGGFSTYLTGGGIFRTTNNGAIWSFAWTKPGSDEAPGNSNLWRVRAAGTKVYASGTGGVFRSDDAGARWTNVLPTTTSSEMRALAVDPGNPGVIYAGSWDANGGIFKSTDGGATWNRSSDGLPARAGIAAIDVDPKDAKHIAAATYWYGVYVSTDGGATWKLAAAGMPDRVRQRLDDVDFAPDGTLYASSHRGLWALASRPAAVLGRKDSRLPDTGVPNEAAAAVALFFVAACLEVRRRRRA
ncbi:MAG: M28 family peptidase [Actinobacteria bacterium]|nr:M28 family peptidase [Actinomycetota bacterium]